jgi:glycerate-2-kinase
VSPAQGVRDRLEALLFEAIAAVDPAVAVRSAVARGAERLEIVGEALPADSRLIVLAVGKAAGSMAGAFEELAGRQLAGGLLVVPDGVAAKSTKLSVQRAAHPIPDARCARAGRAALDLVSSAQPDDVLVVLLSGGASSLLSCPVSGVSEADLAATTGSLLRAGASIDELNAVRKHLSCVAGGRLAAHAASRRIEVLAISDVPGDRLDVIGSGPLAGDPTTYCDALDVVAKRGGGTTLPEAVRAHLEAGARGEIGDTPAPGEACFERVRSHVLASSRTAVAAAHAAADRWGWRALALPPDFRGEARVAGRRLAALGLAVRDAVPVCLIGGGETTVTVRGDGSGGRNQELALAAAVELDGSAAVSLLAAGTDGIDGPTDAAGAYADGGTLARGRAQGLDARNALDENDSHGFFDREGGVLRTGPTGTNVMDLVFVYAGSRKPN